MKLRAKQSHMFKTTFIPKGETYEVDSKQHADELIRSGLATEASKSGAHKPTETKPDKPTETKEDAHSDELEGLTTHKELDSYQDDLFLELPGKEKKLTVAQRKDMIRAALKQDAAKS